MLTRSKLVVNFDAMKFNMFIGRYFFILDAGQTPRLGIHFVARGTTESPWRIKWLRPCLTERPSIAAKYLRIACLFGHVTNIVWQPEFLLGNVFWQNSNAFYALPNHVSQGNFGGRCQTDKLSVWEANLKCLTNTVCSFVHSLKALVLLLCKYFTIS